VAEKKRVLLVEDDESVRQLVRVTLQMNEYDVVEAKDGLEGLLFLDMLRPDAVVLDLMMPDVGGERMLAQLRATVQTKKVPGVIITGKSEVDPEVIGLGGKENFFPKPLDPDAVINRIKALIG
jgi:DNA-binding response OmpR family regulator